MTKENETPVTSSPNTVNLDAFLAARAAAREALDELARVHPEYAERFILAEYARQVSRMRAVYEAPPKAERGRQRVEVALTLNVLLDLDTPTVDWRVGSQFGQRVICGIEPDEVDQEQAMSDFWSMPVLVPKVIETCDGLRGVRVTVLPTAQAITQRIRVAPNMGEVDA